MPPRKKKIQADTSDDKPIRSFLLDSYTFLKKFEKSAAQSIRDQDSARSPSVQQIAIYRRLLDVFRGITDHSPDDLEADRKLVSECDGWCDFFRNQITSLYALPIKHIFQPTQKSEIILSSPLLGLMSYIYHVKLEECWSRQWIPSGARFLNDKKTIGESWENILSAFGNGIRIHVNNTAPSPKLIQFQELVAKVLYEFVSKVMRCDEMDRAAQIADHVKRSLLDAVDALSGGCAVNKELIKSPAILGPSLLSTIIWEHSDFMTANIALQLAFTVAPSIKSGQGKGKKATSLAEARKCRTTWFDQIFPAVKFGKDVHEELVPRIVDMASQKFWNEIGGIQGRIVRDHDSKARAMPIISGSIDGKRICWNEHTTPVFRNCLQFNKSTLTWCSSELLGDNPDDLGEEKTAEIQYEHILNAQVTLREAEKSNSDALTLMLDCKNQPVVDGSRNNVREDQAIDDRRSRLVFEIDAQYDIILARTLKARKIKFSTFSGSSNNKLMILEKAHHRKNNDHTHTIKASEIEGEQKRNMSKVSISREPVCALDADDIQRKTKNIPQISSSYERAATVQRGARSDTSREDDSISEHGKSLSANSVDRPNGLIKRVHDSSALESLIPPHKQIDPQSVFVVTSESSSKDTLIAKPGPTRKRPRSALDVSQQTLGPLDRATKMILSPGASVVSNCVAEKTKETALENKQMQGSIHAETSDMQTRKPAVTNISPEVSIEILFSGSQEAFDKTKSKIENQALPTNRASVPRGNGKIGNPVCHGDDEKLTGKTQETRRIQPRRSSHLRNNEKIDKAQLTNDQAVDNMPIILRLSDIEDIIVTERRKKNHPGSGTHSAARDSRTKSHDMKTVHHDASVSESSDNFSGTILPASVVQQGFGELPTTRCSKELHTTFPQQVGRPISSSKSARVKNDYNECKTWEPSRPNYLKASSQKNSNIKDKPLARASYKMLDALSEKADEVEHFSSPGFGGKRESRPKKTMIEEKSPRNAAGAKENQAKLSGRASPSPFRKENSSCQRVPSSNGRCTDAIHPDGSINQGRNHTLLLKTQVNYNDFVDVKNNYSGTESSGSTAIPNMTTDDCSKLSRIPSKFGGDKLKKNQAARLEQGQFPRHLRGSGGSDQSNSTGKSLEIEQFPSSPLRRLSSAFKKVEEAQSKEAVISPGFLLGQSILAQQSKDLRAPSNIAEKPEPSKSKRERQLRFESPGPVYKRTKVVDLAPNTADSARRRKNSHEGPKNGRGQSSRSSGGKKPQKWEAKHTYGNITLGNSQTRLHELAKLIDQARTSGNGSGADPLQNMGVGYGNDRFDDTNHIAPLDTKSKARPNHSSRFSPEDLTPLFRPKSSPLQEPKKGPNQSLRRNHLLKQLDSPNPEYEASSKNETIRMNCGGSKSHEGLRVPKHEQDMSDCMGKLTQMVIDNIGRKKSNTKRAAFHTQLGVLRLTKNVMRECTQQSEEVLNTTLEQANQRQKRYDIFYAAIQATSEKMDREVKWMKNFLKGRDEEVP